MKIREEILLSLVREPLTLSELAKRLDLDRQLVYHHLRSLVKEGLVERMVYGRTVRYLTKTETFMGELFPTPAQQFLKSSFEEMLWRYYRESLVNEVRYRLMDGSFDPMRLRAPIATFLLHVIRFMEPFYNYKQSIFMREIGSKIATDILIPLTQQHKNHLQELFALVETLFESKLTAMEYGDGIVITILKFLGVGGYDLRFDDLILGILDTVFKEFSDVKSVVCKYPVATRKLHYSYLVKYRRRLSRNVG